jgi:hypothetical protein
VRARSELSRQNGHGNPPVFGTSDTRAAGDRARLRRKADFESVTGKCIGGLRIMQLTEERSRGLFCSTGNYVRQACDKCGQILGCVRWTRRGESGEWCSEKCRDGASAQPAYSCHGCGSSLHGKRKGAIWCSDSCRMRHASQDERNNPKTPIQNTPVTGQLLAS